MLRAVLYIGTLNKQLAICKVNSQGTVISGQSGCYNLIPVFDWIQHCIISIFFSTHFLAAHTHSRL